MGCRGLKVRVQAFQVLLETLGMLELLIIDLLNDSALKSSFLLLLLQLLWLTADWDKILHKHVLLLSKGSLRPERPLFEPVFLEVCILPR